MLNQVKTIVLLGVLSALLIGVAGALAPSAVPLAVGLALLMNVGAYRFSDRLLLASHGARDLAPDEAPFAHHALVELSRRAGLPVPRLVLIDDPLPNRSGSGCCASAPPGRPLAGSRT